MTEENLDQPDLAGAVFLIDGNSLAYRAFYALPESIATSDGFPTNALYGFSTMMLKILKDYRPFSVVVAWDAGKRVFRHQEFKDYKAHRKPTPDNLGRQLSHLGELVEAFGFASFKKEGYEADDILATLAREARERGQKTVIVTADRDALQLVGDQIFVMANTRGISDVRVYDRDAVIKRYGIPPEKVPDFIGLKGDASDNIPGVPGVGDKTAAALLSSFDSLDDLLAHLDKLKGKRRQLLEEYAGQARLSRDLATLNDEVPVDIEGVTAAARVDPQQLRRLLMRYEFNTLLGRLEEVGLAAAVSAAEYVDLAGIEPAELGTRMAAASSVSLAWEERGRQLRVAACTGEGPVMLAAGTSPEIAAAVSRLAGSGTGTRLSCHDYKGLLAVAPNRMDAVHDTMVAAYLLRPTAKTYKLDQLAAAAGIQVEAQDGRPGERALAAHAAQIHRLVSVQNRLMEEQGQLDLFTRVEMPLVRVLADMESAGIRVDLARLGELSHKVADQIDQLADEIISLAGGEKFNIDSPQQLAAVLFERLGLPAARKTKTGFSTDAGVLKGLRDAHPVIGKIETYRELAKLFSTYLRALPEQADPDTWRVHTTFNQTVTATGRISSSNPNLQNIPIRTPLGERIRDCFVAAPGHTLVAADYSQVELRIMAHLSGEPKLRQAFAAGEDVHRNTAAEVFGVGKDQVTPKQRSRAKAVNFGIMYGISAFGLSEQLDISREEAAGYIDAYLARYPDVAVFRGEVIAGALADGFVSTVMGRRRPMPELRSGDPNTRRLGERLAINTVIQGSAADIMKVAMIGSHRALAAAGLKSRLVMQVHDELVFESPEEEADQVAGIARREMSGAWSMDPPLHVDVGRAETWMKAK